MASNLWNELPTYVKESATLDWFKQNYNVSKGFIIELGYARYVS